MGAGRLQNVSFKFGKRAATASIAMLSTVCLMGGAVLAEGTAAFAANDTNIIKNGDFESGTTSWKSGTVWAEDKSSIAVETSDVHGGSQALSVANRQSTDAGVHQALEGGKVVAGGKYTGSMWIKSESEANFNITICSGNGSGCAQIATAKVNAGQWTEVSGTNTLQSDTADFANPYLVVETVWNTTTNDFLVDDVSLVDVGNEPVVRPEGTASPAKKIGMSNPIIDYWYGADPWAMEYNGRVYVYTTGDGTAVNDDGTLTYDYEYDGTGAIANNSFSKVQTLNVLSTDDMVNWRNEGYIRVAGEHGVAKWANNSWAPAAVHKTVNGQEKFYLYFANGGSGIGVLVGDSPVGPWKDGGKVVAPGTAESQGVVWLFDPAVLVDDDGTGYLYYGGGVPEVTDDNPNALEHPQTARVIQLSDDMTHTVGEPKVIDAPAMFEDSGIAKIGDKYYYSYCTNFSHNNTIDGNKIGYGNIAYMTSDSPMGPFTYQGEIMQNPSTFFNVGGNNHHAMVQFDNQWYMVYHAQTVAKELMNGGNLEAAQGYRNTHMDPMSIDANGAIAPITMTYAGVSQTKNFDAYPDGGISASTIAWDSGIADAYDLSSGVRVVDLTTDNSQGQKLSNINDGEWASLANVDFGSDGAQSIAINAAGRAGGEVQVRLDSLESDPVAVVSIEAGDGVSYKEYSAALKTSGVHNVFFTFVGGTTVKADEDNPELFDIAKYRFTPVQTSVPSEVDKSRLQDAVNKADQLKQSDYTPESWAAFSAILADVRVVLTSDTFSQEAVDDAYRTLIGFMNALVKVSSGTENNSGSGSEPNNHSQDESSVVKIPQAGSAVVGIAVTALALVVAGGVALKETKKRRA